MILPHTRGSRKENAGSRAKTRRRCAISPGCPDRAARWSRTAGLLGIAFVTLGGGGNIGNLTLPGGPDAAFGQFSDEEIYEPFVVVDIADLAESETDFFDTDHGEAMDVNDELFACGWYLNASSDNTPFFLDPRHGGSVSDLPLYDGETTYDEGQALRLCESTDYDMMDIIVVGWVDDGTNGEEAAYWTNDGDDWTLYIIPNLGNGGSRAADIDAEGATVVGYWDDSGTQRPFVYDFSTTSKWTFMAGDAIGVDSNGDYVAGTRTDLTDPTAIHHDFATATTSYLSISGYEETYGIGVNDMGDVVGYAVATEQTPVEFHAALWFYENQSWTEYILEDDNPDPVDSTVTAVSSLMDEAVDIVGTSWSATAPTGAFYVTINNSGDYFSYSLDEVSGQESHPSLALFPLRIRREVDDNSWTPETYTGNGLNNIGTLAGSYHDGAPSGATIRPCLYVANDFDNNGVPDIREILLGRLEDPVNELDDNDNWLLDWAEGLRVGLHAPGVDGRGQTGGTYTHKIEQNQIVRLTGLPLLRPEPGQAASGPGGNLGIVDLAYGSSDEDCSDLRSAAVWFYDRLTEWGHDDAYHNPGYQREIVLSIRNPDGTYEDRDEIPDVGDWPDILRALRTFGYRYACIADYIQYGNEAFEGAGEFDFDGTKITELSSGEYPGAVLDVLEWTEEQVEATRIGSALSGRPLRFIGPGFPGGTIGFSWDAEADGDMSDPADRRAFAVRESGNFVNRNRMYFDLHLHYVTSEDWAEDRIDNLLNPGEDSWPDDVPMGRVSLEWGPKGDDESDWWLDDEQDPNDHAAELEFPKYFNPNWPSDPPLRNWEDFIEDVEGQQGATFDGWERAQFFEDGFKFSDLLTKFANSDFVVGCYGPTLQRPAEVFAIAALRATRIPDEYFDDENYILDPEGFTPIMDDYESAAASHEIDPFTPHDEACDENFVCPPCDQ